MPTPRHATLRLCFLLSTSIGFAACGEATTVDDDAGPNVSAADASLADGGADPNVRDAATNDAGPRDGIDAGGDDAGGVDAGPRDGGDRDAGEIDGGDEDGGPLDAGVLIDAGELLDASAVPDAGAAPDAGAPPDAGEVPDAGGGFGTAMSFFVSSTPVFDAVGAAATGDVAGDGDLVFTVPGTSPPVVLRGVAAADAHCQSLAAAVGNPRPNWVAYLSTHGLPEVNNPGVNGPQIDARDRIGSGPWYNASGAVITDAAGNTLVNNTLNVTLPVVLGQGRDANDPANVAAVGAYNQARPNQALLVSETGAAIALNAHDIFTGSDGDGTVYDGGHAERWSTNDRTPPGGGRSQWGTCNDWDYQRFGVAGLAEFAQVGHTDIPGGGFSPSWNSAHDTERCTVNAVISRGGRGHVYCFSPD